MAEPIVGINRGRITAYSFLGKSAEKQREDSDTSIALRQNQIAILNVNNSLNRITEQVAILSTSLQGISNQIRENSVIENLKEQQKARQEQILAEQQIREGKESQVERKIQGALVEPLQRVGAKTQGSLFNLSRFFNLLLGGFLATRVIKSASELSESGQLSLKNLFGKIIKDLAIVGGIFIGINGGFSTALSSISRLAGLLGRVGLNNILLRPFNLIMSLAGSVLESVKGLVVPTAAAAGAAAVTAATAGPSLAAPAAAVAATTAAAAAPPSGSRSSSLPMFGRNVVGPLSAVLNFFTGGSVGESLTAGGLSILPSILRMGGLPGLIASIGLPILAPKAYEYVKPTVEQFIPQLGLTKDDLFRSVSQTPKNNAPKVSVVNVDAGMSGDEPQSVPAATGEATFLPAIDSSNPTNFYLMYSKIQYNVVG